jgi:hypothetical protein
MDDDSPVIRRKTELFQDGIGSFQGGIPPREGYPYYTLE